MQFARPRFLIGLVLGFALVFAIPMGAMADGHIEYGLNREPNAQPLALTNDPASNVTEGELDDPEIINRWLLSESGSGQSDAGVCAGALGEGGSAAPHSYKIAWGGERMFNPPDNLDASSSDAVVTPVEDMNITITITGTDTFDQPIANGDVKFTMAVGWVRPPPRESLHGPHGQWTGSTTVSPTLIDDLPPLGIPTPGVLPGSVNVPVYFTNDITRFEANAALVFILTVECEDDALFELQFGDAGDLLWVWGTPEEDDTDGDGIPDSLDTHPDGTQWSRAEQIHYGTDPLDPNDTPGDDSICEGYTIQEAKDENPNFERGNPDTCPGAGGLNWLLLLLLVLIVVGLAGGAFGAVTTVNKKIRMTVSHDGFQDIAKGESARYELLLSAKGKEDEEVPVELSLKGVPEDWSATVEPAHLTLIAGEEAEPVTVALTVTPPPEEEYEAEAVVAVSATPTDEDGKTSPMKPGTAVKTKTIVNIDVEPPEGEKRKKVKKPKGAPDEETLAAGEGDEGSGNKGKFAGALGRLKRKGKKEEEADEDAQDSGEAVGQEPAQASSEDPDAGTAAVAQETGKPDLKVGEMSHEPADFSAGDEVTTTVPVKNSGDGAVEGLLLRLYVNDDRVDEREVDLQPGDTTEVTFTWTAQPDENRVRVRGGLKEE